MKLRVRLLNGTTLKFTVPEPCTLQTLREQIVLHAKGGGSASALQLSLNKKVLMYAAAAGVAVPACTS